jgi:hypothetical protein
LFIQGDEVWASYAQATVASSCNANRFASYVTLEFCLPDSGCQLEVQFKVVVRVVQVVHHSNFKFKLELQVDPVTVDSELRRQWFGAAVT